MEYNIEHLERLLIVPIIFNKDETSFKNLFTGKIFSYDKKDIHKFDELKKSVGMMDAVDCVRDSINMSEVGFKRDLFGSLIDKKTVITIAKEVADIELKQTRQHEAQDIKRAKIEDKQKIVKEQTRNF